MPSVEEQESDQEERAIKSSRAANMTSPRRLHGNFSEGSPSRASQVALVPQRPFQGTAPNPLASTLARDALLTYAHRIYNTPFAPSVQGVPASEPHPEVTSADHPYTTKLLPLLQNLQSMHPTHLPILLLLGCVHYAVGNYAESKVQNEEILRLDSRYVRNSSFHKSRIPELNAFFSQVEAMCNLGTTCKTMGLIDEALRWWQRAVSIRPSYWDAIVSALSYRLVLGLITRLE